LSNLSPVLLFCLFTSALGPSPLPLAGEFVAPLMRYLLSCLVSSSAVPSLRGPPQRFLGLQTLIVSRRLFCSPHGTLSSVVQIAPQPFLNPFFNWTPHSDPVSGFYLRPLLPCPVRSLAVLCFQKSAHLLGRQFATFSRLIGCPWLFSTGTLISLPPTLSFTLFTGRPYSSMLPGPGPVFRFPFFFFTFLTSSGLECFRPLFSMTNVP